MPEEKAATRIPTFAELEAKRLADAQLLLKDLSPEQAAALQVVRASEAKRLATERAQVDDDLIARITQQVLKQVGIRDQGPLTEVGRPALTVHHASLRCDQTGEEVSADHPNPVAYFKACGISSPTFSGSDTFYAQTDKLEPQHAIFRRENHPSDIEQREMPIAE
jgi:hypothetical protein